MSRLSLANTVSSRRTGYTLRRRGHQRDDRCRTSSDQKQTCVRRGMRATTTAFEPRERKGKWNQAIAHENPTESKASIFITELVARLVLQTELERLETVVVDTRNMYILHANQMNYALKFYIEQFIVDLDKVRRGVHDFFHRLFSYWSVISFRKLKEHCKILFIKNTNDCVTHCNVRFTSLLK